MSDRVSSHDFSSYVYVVNLIDELPLNMMSKEDLENIVFTELFDVERFRFEEENGPIWLTAFLKFYGTQSAELAIEKLNEHDTIGAATVNSLLEHYLQLENALKTSLSTMCTFSFVVVEQVNMTLNHCELMSLFNSYGPVKITKPSSPMCIGYEKFTEALAAKIDQNKWNGHDSYISVKVFPRMKEQVLGFLKARETYSVINNEQCVFDLSLCVVCGRGLQPQGYNQAGTIYTYSQNFNASNESSATSNFQNLYSQSDFNSSASAYSNLQNLEPTDIQSLSFDPNDFVFHLRIESKAFRNLDKIQCCETLPPDTSVSYSDSINSTKDETVGVNMQSTSKNTGIYTKQKVVEVSLLGEESCLNARGKSSANSRLKNHSDHHFNNPGKDQPKSGTVNSFMQNGHEHPDAACFNDYNRNQISTAHSSMEREMFDSSNIDLRTSEIERNFELYGMKMSTTPLVQENDPKVILVPFVYYKNKDYSTQPIYRYTLGTKTDQISGCDTSKRTPKRSSRKNSKKSNVPPIKSNPPIFNETNFPTLADSGKNINTRKKQPGLRAVNSNSRSSSESSNAAKNEPHIECERNKDCTTASSNINRKPRTFTASKNKSGKPCNIKLVYSNQTKFEGNFSRKWTRKEVS